MAFPKSSIVNVRKCGFIDDNFIGFCGPEARQRIVDSGNNDSKYRGIVTPNGLCLAIDGPYNEKTDNAAMLKESQLPEGLERLYKVFAYSFSFLSGL